MSCIPSDRNFRLLDALVGWDPANFPDSVKGITGLDDLSGLTLGRISGTGVSLAQISLRIPPARLARGCDACTWYLVTPAPPASRLLQLGSCGNEWARFDGCANLPLIDAAAVAVDRYRIAVADAGANRTWILDLRSGAIIGEALVDAPVVVAFTPWRDLLAGSDGATHLARFDFGGQPLGTLAAALPSGSLDRMAFDAECRLWLVMRDVRTISLWRLTAAADAFEPVELADLLNVFPPLPLGRVGPNGFCLVRGGPEGVSIDVCFSWYGRPITPDCVGSFGETNFFITQGQLLTGPIDSGVPRCRWHRLQLDAEVPSGTVVEVALSASEAATPPPQGLNDAAWQAFPAGLPHPADWQVLTRGAADALIRQPAGRYLFVRLRLLGNGQATPVVRRIHLDFPRTGSADQLPAVYREEPEAADFTERFLSLFDSALEEIDTATSRFTALLDYEGVPDDVLPWIAGFLGIIFDPSWTAQQRRKLLKEAPKLFRRRGTRLGLSQAIELLFDLDAAIEEPGVVRNWGAVGARTSAPARLNASRLFGRGDARVTLGASELGRSRLRSFGNPDNDPHYAGAFRIVVSVPARAGLQVEHLIRLVDGQRPAHVLAHVRVGRESGFVLSAGLQLGVDTRLTLPAPLALNARGRLGRTAVLQRGPSRCDGLRLDTAQVA